MVAHLEPLLVIAAAAVGGPGHIAELDLVESLLGPHIHRELHLQQPVQLVPVQGGGKLHHRAVGPQGDGLAHRRPADPPGPAHRRRKPGGPGHRKGLALQFLGGLVPVVAVNVPGVELAGHVLVHPQGVHRAAGGQFPAVQGVAQQPAQPVQPHRHPAVAQHRAGPVGLGKGGGGGGGQLGGQQGHRAQRRHPHLRFAAAHRHRFALRRDGAGGKGFGQGQHLGALKALAVEQGQALALLQQGAAGVGGQGAGLALQLGVGGVGLLVDPGNAGPGQDVMELVEQQGLPQPFGGPGVVGAAAQGGQGAPQFQVVQGVLAAAVVLFDGRLGGVGAPVGVEVELAVPGVGRAALFVQRLKKVHGVFHPHPGRTLQVLLPQGELDVVPAGAAAPVPVAEGNQEIFQMALLHPVPPDPAQLGRVGAVGVAGGQEGGHLAAVHPLPGEVMVGEGVALVVAPEDLLGHQVAHPALAQQLGQRGRVAEGVRQPEHPAVHPQLLPVEPLAEDQLPHQRLAGGDVGVRLHIHGPLGDPPPGLDGGADPLVQFGVMVAAHLVGGGLALQEPVVRVLVQQPQLGRKGAGSLAVGLLHRPQPGQVQVGVADGRHPGRGAAVAAFHQRPQRRPGGPVTLVPGFGGLLKVHDAGVGLQPVGDLGSPQRIFGQLVHQLGQGGHVQPELVGVLVPDAVAAGAHPGAAALHRRVAQRAGQHRAGGAGPHVGVVVAGVHLKQQVEPVAGLAAAGQDVVAHRMVGHRHPAGPAGAEGPAVHKQRRLAPQFQLHHDGAAPGLFGQAHPAAAPQVLPGMAPGGARLHRAELPAGGLVGGQVVHRRESFQPDRPQRTVKVLGQHPLPMRQPVFVFRMQQGHRSSLLEIAHKARVCSGGAGAGAARAPARAALRPLSLGCI